MTEICLFAGTTEGRKLSEYLAEQDAHLTVCVATDYGGELISPSDKLTLIDKRLSADDILEMMKETSFDLVIDATHPYAVQVTENILSACTQTNTPYQRVLRKSSDIQNDAVTVPDIDSALELLSKTSGNILLTTGSKDLDKFSHIEQFPERVYARVLPMESSLKACSDAGLRPSHIIAMQGPFSEELNRALIRSVRAEWLVTKDSGEPGGFEAKCSAAQKSGIRLLVIGRPPQQDGLDESEILTFLSSKFGFKRTPSVKIIGIGPGSKDGMTIEAIRAAETADCLIGAERMLNTVNNTSARKMKAISEQTIAGFIHTHPEYHSFAVLMSGDSSFFSGARRLLPLLADCNTEVIPGISSLSCFCAKLRRSAEKIYPVSLHGREHDLIPDIRSHSSVFVLTGGDNNVNTICRLLVQNGLGHLHMYVGERLSYDDEKITCGTADELLSGTYAPLSVILIDNDAPDAIVTHGLPDERFLRNKGEKGLIPMTKSEIRSVCLSKLCLTRSSVCWDIGSGTGSVAIEMALQAEEGHVYAIEQDEAAAALTKKNAENLSAENLTVVKGTAPEICKDLPVPTHVFIGGSTGNLKAIIRMLQEKKSEIRIVTTAISLNTVSELTELTKTLPENDTEVVMIQTSRGKKAGGYQLMFGENPVCVFSVTLHGETL